MGDDRLRVGPDLLFETVAEAHPEILPRSFDLDEFRTDVDLVDSLFPIRSAVQTLFGRIADTYFAAGSEAYAAALLVYQ